MFIVCAYCTTISNLNMVETSETKGSAATGPGATGTTLSAALAVIAAKRPRIVVLENVPKLVKGAFQPEGL